MAAAQQWADRGRIGFELWLQGDPPRPYMVRLNAGRKAVAVSVDAAFGQGGGTQAATDDTLKMNFVCARMSPYMADEGGGSQIATHGIRRRNFAAPPSESVQVYVDCSKTGVGFD